MKHELAISNRDRATGAMLSGEVARRYGHAGLPEDTIWLSLQGHGRAELRRVAGARRHARSRRRGQRLRRQGPVRRQADRAPRPQLRHRAGGEHHRRQHGAVRRHHRRVLLPRRGRRALRRAQLRRGRRGRGHRRPRLRIHDGRRGGGDRPHGAQLRGRHVGRHRLRAGRGRHLRAALQSLHDRSRARWRPRTR